MYKMSMKPEIEKIAKKTIKKTVEKTVEKTQDKTLSTISKIENVNSFDIELSQKKLHEAIIWSEILGKPMCKRRKRR